MSFRSDCKKFPLLQKFADGEQRLVIFWSDGKTNSRVEGWNLYTLKFHLNKNQCRNMKCIKKVGLVNPYNTKQVFGVYDPQDFKW